jgi:DtxR family Mn-dependent transcriptional regulator
MIAITGAKLQWRKRIKGMLTSLRCFILAINFVASHNVRLVELCLAASFDIRSYAMATAGGDLSQSMEDYLEAILWLVRRDKVARVRDIAAHLGVAMPSVTAALKALSHRGLVNYDPYQFVTLTPSGSALAEQVSQRHSDISEFLVNVLGLDPAAAQANACRMEHVVDETVLARLRKFAEFASRRCEMGENWIEQFKRDCMADADETGR